ncbi:MAG: hypothetical protein E7345_01885 [Clostridiales bacterium]|nr:hypothetical protein [Clostridiales bacterium]
MERKECANGLQLVKFGAIRLKGKFSQLFMGTFAMVTPLALVVLVPLIMSMLFDQFAIFTVGVILFAIFVGPMQLGYIKYFNLVLDGEQPSINVIYSQIKFDMKTLRVVYITTLLFFMYIFGGILWLVPAGFAIAFFSMILFFYEKNEYPRLSQAFKECARHMIGNRLALFSYKLVFYFVYFLLFIVGGMFMILVYMLLSESIIISWLIAICSIIIFIFMYSMITVYFHSCNQIFFEDVLSYEDRRQQRKLEEKKLKEEKKKLENDKNKEQEIKIDEFKEDLKVAESVESKKETSTKKEVKTTKSTSNKSTKTNVKNKTNLKASANKKTKK